jgi:hypothetical protein
MKLSPLRVLLKLFALFTLAVSDAKVAGFTDVLVGTVKMRGVRGCVGSSEYATGVTSQCARKCSPSTEL